MNRGRAGFTITEVMVAVVVLSIGVLALMGGATAATRMLSQGQRTTVAVTVAAARLEALRRSANATIPRCGSADFAGGSATTTGVSESWVVPATGSFRVILAIVTYKRYSGTSTDTISTVVNCSS